VQQPSPPDRGVRFRLARGGEARFGLIVAELVVGLVYKIESEGEQMAKSSFCKNLSDESEKPFPGSSAGTAGSEATRPPLARGLLSKLVDRSSSFQSVAAVGPDDLSGAGGSSPSSLRGLAVVPMAPAADQPVQVDDDARAATVESVRNWNALVPVCGACWSSWLTETNLSDGSSVLACFCCRSPVNGESKLMEWEECKRAKQDQRDRESGRSARAEQAEGLAGE